MKNSKIILFLVLLVTGVVLKAQVDQTICFEEEKNYIVDEGDASPDGSYAWTLIDEDGNDLSAQIIDETPGSNDISIDWADTAFDLSLPHTFTLAVTETVNGCTGTSQSYTIQLIEGYLAPTIANVTPVCTNGTNNAFNLTGGTPGAQVSYTITSNNDTFATITSTVTLDASGNGSIPYPALTTSATETFTLTLTSIDDTANTECGALDLTSDNITATVVVNPIPVTTPITPN